MSSTKYDIAIIGAGAAGLQLALAMGRDPYFARQKVLILEKDAKNQNDRTWCYWEKGDGLWDHLTTKEWEKGLFISENSAIDLHLLPYRYKMLKAIDFYAFAKSTLQVAQHFHWYEDEISAVENGTPCTIVGKKASYSARLVFDSRIPADFFKGNDKYTRLLQHFKGWLISTPEDAFDPSTFTMMDYRLRWEDTTSFTYILPLNKREALVEFTFFSPELIADEGYETMLRQYIQTHLSLSNYKVLEVEKGIIPMSDFPFGKYSTDRHIRIGTAGGWVKPSSGYAFKNCQRNAQKIIENIKAGRPVEQGLFRPRFQLYDALFLDVLNRRNDLGPALFENMYSKNTIQQIFAFLDEESSLGADIRMLSMFPQLVFTRSLLNYLIR